MKMTALFSLALLFATLTTQAQTHHPVHHKKPVHHHKPVHHPVHHPAPHHDDHH